MEKLRVAIISPYAHRPGHHWTIATGLAMALRARGHEVTIFTSLAPISTGLDQVEFKVKQGIPGLTYLLQKLERRHREIEVHQTLLRNAEVLVCVLRLLISSLRRHYTVHHFVDATYVLLGIAALGSKARTVYYTTSVFPGSDWGDEDSGTVRRPIKALRRWILRSSLNSGKLAIVCETEAVRSETEKLIGRPVYQIGYAVDCPSDVVGKSVARDQLSLPKDKCILLIFGTHRSGKDYQVVFEAAARAVSKILLLFVGKTISTNKPEEIGKQYAQVKAIHADRFVSNAEAALYFFASDAVLISYEGEYRKGSGVLVEACRFGRPVIASNTGHLRDFVRSHGCGLLFEQGSPESLAAVIDRFAAMPQELRRSLELNAQNAAAKYSWDHLINDYIRIYAQPFAGGEGP